MRGHRPMRGIARFLSDENGASAMQYMLIAALAALAIVGAVTGLSEVLGSDWDGLFHAVSDVIAEDAGEE